LRVELLRRGLSVKTARNIIDSSFRALYRDARAEIEELKGRDPFIDIQWPKAQRAKPDPFTAQERDKIVAHWARADFFYFPWVLDFVSYWNATVRGVSAYLGRCGLRTAHDINQQVEIHGERVSA